MPVQRERLAGRREWLGWEYRSQTGCDRLFQNRRRYRVSPVKARGEDEIRATDRRPSLGHEDCTAWYEMRSWHQWHERVHSSGAKARTYRLSRRPDDPHALRCGRQKHGPISMRFSMQRNRGRIEGQFAGPVPGRRCGIPFFGTIPRYDDPAKQSHCRLAARSCDPKRGWFRVG